MQAIIYIPGLGTRLYDQSIESFAYRFKKALDINDENIKQHYDIEFRKIHFGKDNKQESNISSICATVNGQKKIIYDIYELDYGKTLTDKFEKKNIIIRVLLLFFSIVIKIPEIIFMFVKSVFSGSQRRITLSFKDILQFTFAAAVLLLLSIFGLILILSLISYLPTFLQINNIPAVYSNPVMKFLDDLKSHTGAKYVIGISTLMFLLMPNVKNFISVIATEYLCTMYYLNFGQSRQNIIGKLEELTEYVAECKDYASINFYCYSFGSIIAADALFPLEGRPSYRFANSIQTLVTIGSPIDFINVYWPNYFKNRKKSELKLKKWYNVYSISDILSSNFRYDSKDAEAKYGIAKDSILPTNIPYNILNSEGGSFINTILLLGLHSHKLYWDDEIYSTSCFTNLVLEMKKDRLVESQ